MISEEVVGHIIGGFVILEILHFIGFCWLVNRFTNQPIFRRRNEPVSFHDRSS